jgi:hypothetical protein
MLLVYTHKISPRLSYIFKHIFENMLNLPVQFTTAVEAFVAHSGPKMSYTFKPLGDEFFIAAHPLLFERGINDIQIVRSDWEELPCFFKTVKESSLPFDLFAASFFLLSRYEEMGPQLKSEKGLFDAKQSIALKEDFFEQPLIDLWVFKLYGLMSEVFADLPPLSKKKPQKKLIVDVPLAFQYSHRSLLVVIELFFKALINFDFLALYKQLAVYLRIEQDPYDTFSSWEDLFKNAAVTPHVFFRYAKSSIYETNLSIFNHSFQSRIKQTGDFYPLGLLLSAQAQLKPDQQMNKEKRDFYQLTRRQVKCCRVQFAYVPFVQLYKELVAHEFTEDFSMGYSGLLGFRASTATPFYFYDLTNEVQLPLKVAPVIAEEKALKKGKKAAVFNKLETIYENLPLPCNELIIAVSNGFLNKKRQKAPNFIALKNYIK